MSPLFLLTEPGLRRTSDPLAWATSHVWINSIFTKSHGDSHTRSQSYRGVSNVIEKLERVRLKVILEQKSSHITGAWCPGTLTLCSIVDYYDLVKAVMPIPREAKALLPMTTGVPGFYPGTPD